MSTEGWWIRASDGKAVAIHDHEIDIRNPVIAKRLGVPTSVFKEFSRFVPVRDRIQFLTWLLGRVPIIRARDHGIWLSLEWSCRGRDNPKAFRAIHKWGRTICGPCTLLRMVNLETNEPFESYWLPFDMAMKAGKRLRPVEDEKI